jgi:hypothetical protein
VPQVVENLEFQAPRVSQVHRVLMENQGALESLDHVGFQEKMVSQEQMVPLEKRYVLVHDKSMHYFK